MNDPALLDATASFLAAEAQGGRARPHGQLAGMTRRDRWADWDRSPFTAASRKHISMWERPQ